MNSTSIETYRDDLHAARVRIEQLEDELEIYRTDPSFERVDVANERLARALAIRRRAHRLMPRVLIGSFVAMGAFAMTNPALPPIVQALGWTLCVLGAVSTAISIALLLALSAPRPRSIQELERQLRIAKGEVGVAALPPARS